MFFSADQDWGDYVNSELGRLREEYPHLPDPFLAGIWDSGGLLDDQFSDPLPVAGRNWPTEDELPEVTEDEMDDLMKSIHHYLDKR